MKYESGSKGSSKGMESLSRKIPADLPEDVTEKIQHLAAEAFRAINGNGVARIDFMMNNETGEVFINEINTIPGQTPISMYPKLFEAVGVPYSELIDRLVAYALERGAV